MPPDVSSSLLRHGLPLVATYGQTELGGYALGGRLGAMHSHDAMLPIAADVQYTLRRNDGDDDPSDRDSRAHTPSPTLTTALTPTHTKLRQAPLPHADPLSAALCTTGAPAAQPPSPVHPSCRLTIHALLLGSTGPQLTPASGELLLCGWMGARSSGVSAATTAEADAVATCDFATGDLFGEVFVGKLMMLQHTCRRDDVLAHRCYPIRRPRALPHTSRMPCMHTQAGHAPLHSPQNSRARTSRITTLRTSA